MIKMEQTKKKHSTRPNLIQTKYSLLIKIAILLKQPNISNNNINKTSMRMIIQLQKQQTTISAKQTEQEI